MSFFIVTDANPQIGRGHASRQVAVAKRALQLGLRPKVISRSEIVRRICDDADLEFIGLRDRDIVRIISESDSKRAVIDVHESAFPEYRHTLPYLERLLLVVSEVGCPFGPFGHHLVRLGSDLEEWRTRATVETGAPYATQVHAGRAWVPFRDEFENTNENIERDGDLILIVHGGTDPHGLTLRTIEALDLTTRLWKVTALITDDFSDIPGIYQAARCSKHDCSVVRNTDEIANWMRKTTVAIMNGGNVRYELCRTGTPFVAVSFQERQYDCTEQISKIGAGINLGVMDDVCDSAIAKSVERLLLDSDVWTQMNRVMVGLFDHRGTDRLLKLLD